MSDVLPEDVVVMETFKPVVSRERETALKPRTAAHTEIEYFWI